MRGFLEKVSRTNGRTDRRTDERPDGRRGINGPWWNLGAQWPRAERKCFRKRKRHFSCFIVIQLSAKNQKDPMRGFLEKVLRTNKRRWINWSHFCLRQGTKNDILQLLSQFHQNPVIVLWELRGLTQKQGFSRHIDLYQVMANQFRNFWPSFIKIQCSIWKLWPKMSIFGHF